MDSWEEENKVRRSVCIVKVQGKHRKLSKGNHLCVLWGLESYSCHICLRHSATIHKEKIIDREKEKSGKESHHTPTP